MGILRSQVNISDIEIIEEPSSYGAKKMNRTSKGKIKMGKSLSVRPEINLLGRTVEKRLQNWTNTSMMHCSPIYTRSVLSTERNRALRKGIH